MKIELYTTRSFGQTDTARAMIDEALAEANEAGAEVTVIQVDSPEEARSKRMFGAPTIRVNGIDIEYGDREPEETTTGTRYYATPDGWKPLPSRSMIVRAITVARAREGR